MLPEPLPLDALDLPPDEVDARLRAARADGMPSWVWPDVRPDAWRAALRSIVRAVRAVSTGAPPPGRLEIPAGVAAGAVRVAALTSGTGPLLGRWLEDGRLEADAEIGALLRFHIAHGRTRARRLAGAATDALDILADAGLRATVLKGAHTARAYFPEPGARPSVDVDLLVAPDALDAAERALAAAGYAESHRQPRLRRSAWTPPDSPRRLPSLLVIHADGPYTVDLHGTLDRHFGLRMSGLDALAADMVEPWPAFHPAASVLAQPLLVAYLAAHVSNELTHLTLVRLVELVRVLRTDAAAGRLRWDELHALLERVDALHFLYPAFELAERLAPGTIDPDFRDALKAAAPRRMRRVVARLDPVTVQRLEDLSLEERFMWARGPVEHLRRALEMVWPARIGTLRQLGRTYAERLRRIAGRRVRWRADGHR